MRMMVVKELIVTGRFLGRESGRIVYGIAKVLNERLREKLLSIANPTIAEHKECYSKMNH